MNTLPQVVIVELGSQVTRLIERTLRELGVRSAILSPKQAAKWFKKFPVRAVILSGGPASVYEKGAPAPPRGILSLRRPDGEPVPVLGICYGMQWIARELGGKVEPIATKREYGAAEICDMRLIQIFAGMENSDTRVWMSHGDSVIALPPGFSSLAKTRDGAFAAMANEAGTIYGVQFHPEVNETACGRNLLANFVFKVAGCDRDWEATSMVASIRETVATAMRDKKAVIGFSGGVDSTTLTALIAPSMGRRLRAITIDAGNLRKDEMEEIRRHAKAAGVKLTVIKAAPRFVAAIGKTIDAEEKRAHFRRLYAAVFRQEAKRFGASVVIQGTLAPDAIESGGTGGAVIKTHHNYGLNFGRLKHLDPIDHLFKYEVREIGKGLGLPESVWKRQPFPGPGLFIRVVGAPVTKECLGIVREADARARAILERHGLYDGLSQLVVGLVGVNTVGVKGDARAYGHMLLVRAVKTIDFMTAKGVIFPEPVAKEINSSLVKLKGIVRVVFDPTDKPPATTELE